MLYEAELPNDPKTHQYLLFLRITKKRLGIKSVRDHKEETKKSSTSPS